jgi:hypothetical protein
MGMKNNSDAPEEKKLYQAPRLVTYGTLQRLTSGVKAGTKADGPDGRPAFNTRT